MKRLTHTLAALLLAFSTSANALLITDSQDPYVFLKEGQSHSVIHDLSGHGVSSSLNVNSAWLRLGFSDGFFFGDLAYDLAKITGSGINEIFEVDGTHMWGFDIRWLNVGQDGIDSLNNNGKLAITVTAMNTSGHKGFNDFWWKTSDLSAKVESASVPEPGALSLLGISLLMLGVIRRRRAAV